MPLVGFDMRQRIKNEGTQSVLVFSERRRSIGLLIDEIVDIAEAKLDVKIAGERPGVLGYALFRRLAEAISSDGYLVLGAAETALGLSDRFRMVSDKPGLYTVNATSQPLLPQQRMTPTRPRLIAINGGR